MAVGAACGNRGGAARYAMPLRCLDDAGRDVHAFALSPDAWMSLAADNRARRHLAMPCCEARVSAKRSALGLQFFAHVGRGGCTTGDETPEHLALKQIAVDAARAHGWQAETEVAAADGSWRADVLATRGRARVAVEVQWSPQDDAETLRRQAQYAAAGVRGLWLFRQRSFPVTADLPALRVTGSIVRGFTMLGGDASTALDAAFAGALGFGFPIGATVDARITEGVATCWGRDCGALNRIVVGVDLHHGASDCALAIADLPPNAAATRAIVAVLPSGDMIANVRARRADVVRPATMVSGCFRCGLPLDTVRVAATTHRHLATVAVTIDADLATVIAGHARATLSWGIAGRVAPPRMSR
jgi:competence protein CoiA